MRWMHRHVWSLLLWLVLVLLGVNWFQQGAIAAPAAQAYLTDPAGKTDLQGQVWFSETSRGLLVEAKVKNAPAGTHGFHIHEKASCADSGNAAGGHFNPDKAPHGLLLRDGLGKVHAGDLGNIEIQPNGQGSYRQLVPGLTLAAGQYSVVQHAFMLHGKPDDLTTQPTGNAGARIGCGIITLKGA